MSINTLTGYSNAELNAINAAFAAPARYLTYKITLGHWVYNNNSRTFVTDIAITRGIYTIKIKSDADGFPLGKTICTSAELKFSTEHVTEGFIKSKVLRPEIGIALNSDDDYRFYELGYFNPDSVTSDDNFKTVTVKAYDDMYKLNNKKFVKRADATTVSDYIAPLWGAFGATTDVVLNLTISAADATEMHGTAARDALAYIAAKQHGCYVINRNGVLQLIRPEINTHIYNTSKKEKMQFKLDEETVSISKVLAGTDADYAEATTNLSDGYTLALSSPLITRTENLSDTISLINNIGAYSTGSLNTRGNPAWAIGEVINFKDSFQNDRKIIISAIDYDVTGSTATIKSVIPEEELMYGTEKATKAYVKEAIKEAASSETSGGGGSSGDHGLIATNLNLSPILNFSTSASSLDLCSGITAEGTNTRAITYSNDYIDPRDTMQYDHGLKNLFDGRVPATEKSRIFIKKTANANPIQFRVGAVWPANTNFRKTYCLDILFYKFKRVNGNFLDYTNITAYDYIGNENNKSFYAGIQNNGYDNPAIATRGTRIDIFTDGNQYLLKNEDEKVLMLGRARFFYKPSSGVNGAIHINMPCAADEGIAVIDCNITELTTLTASGYMTDDPRAYGYCYDSTTAAVRAKTVEISAQQQSQYGNNHNGNLKILYDRLIFTPTTTPYETPEEIVLTANDVKRLLAMLN